MKGIGLPDPENLNAHVRPHRTRRGGANPGFRASRVCPNRLSFANFIFRFKIKIKSFSNSVIIFGSEIAVEIAIEIRIFPCPVLSLQ